MPMYRRDRFINTGSHQAADYIRSDWYDTYPDACMAFTCNEKPHPGLDVPLCPKHARKAYMSLAQFVSASDPYDALHKQMTRGRTGRPIPKDVHRHPTATTAGSVYFIEFTDGLIKIGYSTDVRGRLRALGGKRILATVGPASSTSSDA